MTSGTGARHFLDLDDFDTATLRSILERSSALKAGARVPSTRDLARQLGVDDEEMASWRDAAANEVVPDRLTRADGVAAGDHALLRRRGPVLQAHRPAECRVVPPGDVPGRVHAGGAGVERRVADDAVLDRQA